MLGTQNNLPYLKWTVHNKDQLNGLADLVNKVHIFKSGNFSVAVVVFFAVAISHYKAAENCILLLLHSLVNSASSVYRQTFNWEAKLCPPLLKISKHSQNTAIN